MSQPNADRSLLFGLLALQTGLVDQSALVAAFHAWTQDKTRPMGQILVDHGDLSASRLGLIEALVEEHVKQHGDTEQSLAALSAVGPVCQKLARIRDSDLQASLLRVPEAHDEVNPFTMGVTVASASQSEASTSQADGSAVQPGATVDVPAKPPTERFRIVRPHARGGIGEVYVAIDEELKREVALKEIQDRHADDPKSRSRFLAEAEITGGLEHPGIVPVYGLGQYADGRPFYAMRFIRGDSLKEAIVAFHKPEAQARPPGERLLDLRKLLGRFIDVCDAVAYAHSRGVLHRDLKPGNIMIGKYGETLVVDWGLAKAATHTGADDATPGAERPLVPSSASGSIETLPGHLIGTPQYMSPEQAAGQLDKLGPASDVYSLGATLCCLLTGKPPFHNAEVGEVLKRVQKGTFPRPRQVDPAIAPALEAICLKAMSLAPGDRYASPHDLADDLEHWLADEPVSAYREGALPRLARWGRRHKAAVASAAALLLTAVIALAVGLFAVDQQKREVERQKARADKETLAAQQERNRANEQTLIAQRQKARAEERFTLALDALNALVFDVGQSKLQNAPGGQKLRREILSAAADHLGKLVANAEHTGDANHGIAWAYFQSGDVARLLGQTDVAHKHYEEGHKIAQKLAAASPQSPLAKRDLATALERLGEISVERGEAPAARDYFEKSLALSEALRTSTPNDAQSQRDLSIAHERLGDFHLRYGDAAAARSHHEQGLALAETLAQTQPADARAQRDLSVSHVKSGDVSLQLGDASAARTHYAKSLELAEALVQATPESAAARRDLAASCEKLGRVALVLGDAAEARRCAQKTLALREAISRDDPDNMQAKRELAVSLNKLGNVAQQLGEVDEARKHYERGLDLSETLAKVDPNSAQAKRDLMVSHEKLGNVSLKQGDAKAAREHYQAGLALAESNAERDPANAQAKRDLWAWYTELGQVTLQLGDAKAARDYDLKGLDIVRGLAKADPESAQAKRDLSISCDELGNIYLKLDDVAAAREILAEALDLAAQLAAADPKNAQAKRDLSVSHNKLGDVSMKAGDAAAASESYRKGLEIAEALVQADPNDDIARRDLSISHSKLAEASLALGENAAARDHFTQCLKLRQKQAEAHPESVEAQADLVTALANLAGAQSESCLYADSVTSFRRAGEVLDKLLAAGKLKDQPEWAARRRDLTSALTLAEAALRARDNGDFAESPSTSAPPELLAARAVALIEQGQYSKAGTIAERIRTLQPKDPEHLFRAARVLGRIVAVAPRDEGDFRGRCALAALNYLTEARALGAYKTQTDRDRLARADDFASLRNEPGFQRLLDQVKAEPPPAVR